MAASAGQTRQQIDWYVITEDADLTLRITTGLKIGEDRWGELTLNHPVAANRWLEFTIDADGNLSARPCRRDIEIDLDGAPQTELLLRAGDPISLPHNQIYISDSFRRGRTDATPAMVRCAEMNDVEDDSQRLAQTVITESDVPAEDPEPTGNGVKPVNLQQSLTDDGDNTTQTVRLEDSLYAARTTTGTSVSWRTEDSIETALIPVDAEPPFGTDELSAALQRPIEFTERIRRRDRQGQAASPEPRAANSPILTPAVTEIATEQRNLTYLWTLSGILVLGVLTAIIVATNSVPEPRADQPAAPITVVPAPQPANQSRAESLMASVQNIIDKSDQDDLAAWEFAVRSYEYILAQEPDNLELAAKLSNARNRTAVLRAQQGITPTFMPGVSESTDQPRLGPEPIASSEPSRVVQQSAVPAISDTRPTEFPVGPVPGYEPLTLAQIEFRLDGAERRIASGEINNPVGISATSLILSVLGADPGNARAISLLNRAADRLVLLADRAYSDGDEFRARNTLEEIFAFHPRFGPANQRWRQWTGRPGPGERTATAP